MGKKIISSIIIGSIIGIGTFYFWASSPTIEENSFNLIVNNEDASSENKADTFSIITFNIGYLSGMTNNISVDRSADLFTQNLNKSLSLFQQIKPDFIALQEVDINSDRSFNTNQVSEILTHQPFRFSATVVNWNKTYVPFPYWPIRQQFGQIISGQAVLSQYPIVKNEIIPMEKPVDNPFYYNAFYLDRLAQITTIKINGKELVIINVHLEAFHANTRDLQVKQILKAFHTYSQNYPVIVCGDFNSTPPGAKLPYQDDHVIQTLLADSEMEMAINLEQNQDNERANYTFNSDQPDKRLDYVFYNPKFIQMLDARVLHEANQVSDHLPVWMRFTFR
jgi:endonuclease/exonuclease/phosphatase family metal-dependent hydrolase